MINTKVYEKFAAWLDELFKGGLPEGVAAFCFNLYEGTLDGPAFGVQPIASDRFDADDKYGDWACYEIWSSDEDDMFFISLSDEEDKSGEHAQAIFAELIREYLKNGRNKYVLLNAKGVGIGFTDGDLEIIYINDKE